MRLHTAVDHGDALATACCVPLRLADPQLLLRRRLAGELLAPAGALRLARCLLLDWSGLPGSRVVDEIRHGIDTRRTGHC
jgi:hypothetical protein